MEFSASDCLLSYKGSRINFTVIMIMVCPWQETRLEENDLDCNIKRDVYYSISNIDHMRISGTEPSSVILSQTKHHAT